MKACNFEEPQIRQLIEVLKLVKNARFVKSMTDAEARGWNSFEVS